MDTFTKVGNTVVPKTCINAFTVHSIFAVAVDYLDHLPSLNLAAT